MSRWVHLLWLALVVACGSPTAPPQPVPTTTTDAPSAPSASASATASSEPVDEVAAYAEEIVAKAAATAPQEEWPRTTTRGAPRTPTANSIDPILNCSPSSTM